MIKKLVLTAIAVVFLLCPQVKANQQSVSNVKETIVKHSLELGIDPALALSIAKSESGFKHESRSRHGAVGVFQLMPSTAKRLGVNPYYLSDNIKGGLMYYKRLYDMFGSTELALAAYNAGPGIVKRCNNQVPPIGETKRFVSDIMSEYHYQKSHPDPSIKKVRTTKSVSTAVYKSIDKSSSKMIVKQVNVKQTTVKTTNLKPITLQTANSKPAAIKHATAVHTKSPVPKSVLPPQGIV